MTDNDELRDEDRAALSTYVQQPLLVRAWRRNGKTYGEVAVNAVKSNWLVYVFILVVYTLIDAAFAREYYSVAGFINLAVQLAMGWAIITFAVPFIAQLRWPQTFNTYGQDKQFLQILANLKNVAEPNYSLFIDVMSWVTFAPTEEERDRRLNEVRDVLGKGLAPNMNSLRGKV